MVVCMYWNDSYSIRHGYNYPDDRKVTFVEGFLGLAPVVPLSALKEGEVLSCRWVCAHQVTITSSCVGERECGEGLCPYHIVYTQRGDVGRCVRYSFRLGNVS